MPTATVRVTRVRCTPRRDENRREPCALRDGLTTWRIRAPGFHHGRDSLSAPSLIWAATRAPLLPRRSLHQPEPHDDHRLLVREPPPGLAEQHRGLVAAAVVEAALVGPPVVDRRDAGGLGVDDVGVDLAERHNKDPHYLHGPPAVVEVIHDRQALADSRRAALQVPLASQ